MRSCFSPLVHATACFAPPAAFAYASACSSRTQRARTPHLSHAPLTHTRCPCVSMLQDQSTPHPHWMLVKLRVSCAHAWPFQMPRPSPVRLVPPPNLHYSPVPARFAYTPLVPMVDYAGLVHLLHKLRSLGFFAGQAGTTHEAATAVGRRRLFARVIRNV